MKSNEELIEELKESQRTLNSFFNQSTAGAFFMMLDEPVTWNETVDKRKILDYVFDHHRITKVNQQMLLQYRTTEENFLGRTPRDLFLHDLEYGYRIWTEFFDNGKLHIDTDERMEDGSQLWIRGDYECLYDSNGRITGHFGLQIDITANKEAEEELKKSKLLLSTSIDSQKDTIIFSIDRNYKYLHFNKAHSDAMKYAWNSEAKLGVNILNLITNEDDRIRAKNNYDLAFNGESHSTIQVFGEVYKAYYESFFNPIIDENGNTIGCTGLARNITERKELEEKLLFIGKAIESTSDAIGIADLAGHHFYQNKAFTELFGYLTAEEFEAARGIDEVTRNPEVNREMVDDVIKKRSWSGELEMVTKNGKVFPAFQRADIIKDNDGKIIGRIRVITDLSQQKKSQMDLQKSESRYRTLIESSSDAIFCVDENGQYQFTNKLFASTFGKTPEYFIGKTFWDVYDKEHADLRFEATKRLFQTGQSETLEVEVPLPDRNLYFLATTNPVKDEKGKVILNLTHAADITELKEAEEALRHSNIFNETLLNTIPFGMDIVDNTGTILFQSEKFKMIFGESAVGKKCWELYRDDKKQCIACPLFNGIIIGETETYESYGVLGNRIFEINHTGMMFQGKKAMLEIFQDITERKNAEKKLIRSEHELKKAQEITHIGSWYLDVATNEVIWTEELYKMYGFDPALPPPPYTEHMKLFTRESWELLSNSLANTRDTGIPYELELQTIRRDGSNGWMWVRGETQTDKDGNTVGLWGAAQEISERKERENQLEIALRKATESERLKSAFLANMSHEIRTPMNGILGFTDLLKNPALSIEEQIDFIQTIEISGERMLNTINNIVDISKIEAGLIKVNIKESNINDKIEFTYKFFFPEVDRKGLNFIAKTSLPGKIATIKTDNEKVYGILTNLIKNAIKFTIEGSIEFGYFKKGSFLEFYVKDTGIGIPEYQKKMIFERFRQGNEDLTRRFEGSGLGLSIAKSYVEMLGGKIWVESEENVGSVFYFTIPYVPVIVEKITVNSNISKDNLESELSDLNILIVEDDEISYSLINRTIQKISKKILHAVTGVEAVEICRYNPEIDVVLMDIRMPKMNGLDATSQIRNFNNNIIIIAQTAYGFESDCVKALEAGCNDYISKPIDKSLLLELIKKHTFKK